MMYRVAEKDVVVPDVQMRGNMHGCIKEPAKDTGGEQPCIRLLYS